MKTLTANANTQRAATYREPHFLFQIDRDDDASWAMKYSGSSITIGEDTYTAYVQSWGKQGEDLPALMTSVDLNALGSIDNLKIVMKNSVGDSAMFHTEASGYNLEGKPCRFGVWFEADAADADDIVWLFYGEINKVEKWVRDGTPLDCIAFGARNHRELPDHEVSRDDFPDTSDESIGKKLRRIYGDVEGVPAISVTRGVSTQLWGAHGTGDTTIRVVSVEGFPASGTIQVGEEQIDYTAITDEYDHLGTTIGAFLDCTREANGTDVALHQNNDEVSEIVSSSVFVLADHACKAVGAVYVENTIADPADYSVNRNDTTTLPGRTLTTITFTGQARYWKRSEAAEEMQIFPDSEGDDNDVVEDWRNAIDEPEANTSVAIAEGDTLEVERTEAVEVGARFVPDYETTVIVDEDARVDSDNPDTNYSGATTISLQYRGDTGEGPNYAFLKLEAANIPPQYDEVSLFFYTTAGDYLSNINALAFQASSNWDESTITWNTKPTTGALLGEIESAPDGPGLANPGWNEISLSATADLATGIILRTNPVYGVYGDPVIYSEDNSEYRPYFKFTTTGHTEAPDQRKGAPLEIHAAISFSTDGEFEPGDLTLEIDRSGLSMTPVELWDPKYDHIRPEWDTVDRQISSTVANAAGAQPATYQVVLQATNVAGSSGWILEGSQVNLVDSNWDSYAHLRESYNQPGWIEIGHVRCDGEHYTPPSGTITAVRWKLKGAAAYSNRAYFYIGGVEILNTWGEDLWDGARHYGDWLDVSAYEWDMETTLTDPNNTYINVQPPFTGGANTWKVHMVGLEVQYIPTEGSSSEQTEMTVTNYANLGVLGAVDMTDLADPWDWFVNTAIKITNVSFSGIFKVHSAFFLVKFLPIELVPSDNVSADVQGVEDIGDGTGTLLENPADIINHILETVLAIPTANIDSVSFAAARASLDSIGAKFGFALLEGIESRELLASLAFQARCWLYTEINQYKLQYREAIYGAAVRTISGSGVTARIAGSGYLEPLGLAAIKNEIVVKFDKDYGADSDEPYRDSSTDKDDQSQVDFGIQKLTIEADALRTKAFADNFVQFLLTTRKNPRSMHICQTGLGNIDLERGAIVQITDTSWGLVAAKGEIVSIDIQPGSAPSSRPPLMTLYTLLEPYEFYWGDSDAGIVISSENMYFIVDQTVVARLTSAGDLYLKGYVVESEVPQAATGTNPLYSDTSRNTICFALNDNTRIAEIDGSGNLLLLGSLFESEIIAQAGNDNEITNDASNVYININGTRCVVIDNSGNWLMAGNLIAPANDSELL